MEENKEKKFKNFNSFFEDYFYSIPNEEDKRIKFIYYALLFSSQSNLDISYLYQDLKKIIEKLDSIKYLKYDKDFYVTCINNYLEKIEVFIVSKDFFNKEENYNYLRDIIKLFNRHYKTKKVCPKEVFNNLDDLCEILKIKMRHKIPETFQERMKRHIGEFEKMLKEIKIGNIPEPVAEEKKENKIIEDNINNKNHNINNNYQINIVNQYKNNNINRDNYQNNMMNPNINNNYGYYNNDNMNLMNNNQPPAISYPMMNNQQNFNKNNPILNYNQLNQFNSPLKNNININNIHEHYNYPQNYNNQNNLNNLSIKEGLSSHENFSFDMNENFSHEGAEFAEKMFKKMNNNINNSNEMNNNMDYNEFVAPMDYNNINNQMQKSKQFTNENESEQNSKKSNIRMENPYKNNNQKNNGSNFQSNESQSDSSYNSNKKIKKKSVIERRKKYAEVGKGLKQLTEDDFDD